MNNIVMTRGPVFAIFGIVCTSAAVITGLTIRKLRKKNESVPVFLTPSEVFPS